MATRSSHLPVFVALSLLGIASVASAQSTPQRTYILSGFTAADGEPLGTGRGAACVASFRITDTKVFSIVATHVQGSGREPDPNYARIDSPTAVGSPRNTSPQTDGSGWLAVDNSHNGQARHDGTWKVYVPKPRSPSGGILACSEFGSTVRVVFPNAAY